MTLSDFLSRHPACELASPNEIIPISFHIRELINNANKLDNTIDALKYLGRLNTIVDIFCPPKKAPCLVKSHKKNSLTMRGSFKMATEGEVRRPEHIP